MRIATTSLALLFSIVPAIAQQKPDGPSDEKAHKTYVHALEAWRDRQQDIALDEFKKADKQDGGHCRACQKQMIRYGIELSEWKTAELAADEMIVEATDAKEVAMAHFQSGAVFINEGLQ
jgi:hypothetical protein